MSPESLSAFSLNLVRHSLNCYKAAEAVKSESVGLELVSLADRLLAFSPQKTTYEVTMCQKLWILQTVYNWPEKNKQKTHNNNNKNQQCHIP